MKLCTIISYREAVDTLNKLFHRSPETSIKLKTYMDFCTRTGNRLESNLNHHASMVLENAGFDPETGLPSKEPEPKYKEAAGFQNESEIMSAIEKWNDSQTEPDRKLSFAEVPKFETAQDSVYISIDDIGVKHQKEHRNPEYQKSRVYVQNTVAVIETQQSTHTLTNIGQRRTTSNILAYLIEHQMLSHKHLVFLTDGAKDIRHNIEEVYGFRKYTIILDWYHLKKRCQEYLSMSVKGGKESRNQILRKLLQILWIGNVDQAINYLKQLPDTSLRTINRINDLCAYFEKNRICIPCYALRKLLSLKISSNRVEKANDLAVAKRQKHLGMSWSTIGSGALAQIQVYFLNYSNFAT